jgi:Asp-tRNA(Asn)/Glu-tRNA(Gln) amidotransferase B subunit
MFTGAHAKTYHASISFASKQVKEAAINALIVQAMMASKGKANPAQLTELLLKKMAG